MLDEPRYVSLEQAMIVSRVYAELEDQPAIVKRAHALRAAMEEMEIRIDPDELIVGNRTAGVRAGVVFPESGVSWIDREIDGMATRPQDKFHVREGDAARFREQILPAWKGRSLEDVIRARGGPQLDAIARVVKINQKDHAQGHICPDVAGWLAKGPAGIAAEAAAHLAGVDDPYRKDFYAALQLTMEGACAFMRRYAALAGEMADSADAAVTADATFSVGAAAAAKIGGRPPFAPEARRAGLREVSRICARLAEAPPDNFHEAVQSIWFLFALLHLESNASSFSPGRMDQYLLPFYERDLAAGRLTPESALEIIEALWLKFNQIVYLRNSHSARFFAGFPIGFNIAVGGQLADGSDASNALSYLFLQAQEDIGLPQPNLSARLHARSPQAFVRRCVEVVARGSGMPQCFNDEAIVPALEAQGISREDALDYAIVGCVELTTHGNNLGWSDAAMFNMPKALELAMNDGVCLLTGRQLGPKTGRLEDFARFEDLEAAFAKQLEHFTLKMIECCELVEQAHMDVLPSPFLSGVIDDCMETGMDVTAGGAHYNLSGIQVIQGANVADSLAALKKLVFDEGRIGRSELMDALRTNFAGREDLRQTLLHHAPKYGNDVEWVDELAHRWVRWLHERLKGFVNMRGGPYHTGLYTVSAHVPMGENVGAAPDGRRAKEPLADGGMSPMYGRDVNGPTAVLKSVSRIDSMLGSNGTLLNMKFLPAFFSTEDGILKFVQLLRTFVKLKIPHIQFNVLNREDLLAARKDPEKYRNLTVRVAGYTAYFVELAEDLQDEIIERTSYGDI